ncbi:hypothetical protein ACQ86G_22875 [Roseateles chitinivorans]|uniref:hypothetical protein n=1 Tax=Roseateles chitinivorans TaxID=2917965 RepID=UPI003D677A63
MPKVRGVTPERSSWRRYPSPDGLQFRCSASPHAIPDADAAATAREHAAQIRARHQDPAIAADWISLVYRLPDGLRQVLLEELDQGNLMVEIGESSWPSPRCIVAMMRDRFHGEGKTWPHGVVWHVVNDPRQWREDVAEMMEGQEFLLMA